LAIMVDTAEIETERLLLRQWKEDDLGPFAELNRDPKVMEYFPSVLSREESDALAKKCIDLIEKNGWGLWAVSCPGVSDFIGFVGLLEATFDAPFTPAVEIGWRLAAPHWGKGYATEAAKAVLEFAFSELELGEVVSFTAIQNTRSMKVMERIGMTRNPQDDFDHPKLAKGHRLERHVLYRLQRQKWMQQIQGE
jgi:3-dehydroquinate dehydratase/shikimate dehydrogenase